MTNQKEAGHTAWTEGQWAVFNPGYGYEVGQITRVSTKQVRTSRHGDRESYHQPSQIKFVGTEQQARDLVSVLKGLDARYDQARQQLLRQHRDRVDAALSKCRSKRMSGLIERLEGAERGSREVDAAIWLLFNRPEYTGGVKALEMRGWYDGRGHLILETDAGEEVADDLGITDVTTSLDAALALADRVLPGWYWRAGRTPMGHWHHGRYTYGWAHMSRTDASNCDRGDEATGWAETPALALCAAILRAHEASQ